MNKTSKLTTFNLNRIIFDAIVILLGVFAVYLLIILITFHPDDSGFHLLNNKYTFHNLGGQNGAYISSLFIYLFGLASFIIPFIILVMIWTIFIDNNQEVWFYFLVRLVGIVVLIIASATILTLFYNHNNWFFSLPYSSGGIVGYEISNLLMSKLELLATTLLLLAITLISILLTTFTTIFSLFFYTGYFLQLVSIFLMYLFYKTYRFLQEIFDNQIHNRQDKKRNPNSTQFNGQPQREIKQVNQDRIKNKYDGKLIFLDKIKNLLSFLSNKQAKSSNVNNQYYNESANHNTSYTNGTTVNRIREPKVTEELHSINNPNATKTKGVIIDDNMDNFDNSVNFGNIKGDNQSTKSSNDNFSVANQTSSNTVDAKNVRTVAPNINLPSINLLNDAAIEKLSYNPEELEYIANRLVETLKDFNIQVNVEAIMPGPVVTTFEIKPAPGVTARKIVNLESDIARNLSVKSVRIVEIIEGKDVMGIEIPNKSRQNVWFKEIVSSSHFQDVAHGLPVALGKDIMGETKVLQIETLPHLLIAGTTGSGKSVGINSILLSLLYKKTPRELKLILIDPKFLELSIYQDIPYLLTPVITNMEEAGNSLKWCVEEMDRRYQLMAKLNVKNMQSFNQKVSDAIINGNPIPDPTFTPKPIFDLHSEPEPCPTLEELPYIVIIIDEFADMMMTVGKKVEELVTRLAQKARAAGIHLVIATQRPSVNIITGIIKANIPTRISFQVTSQIDSKTIIEKGGAEKLLGKGDMLFLQPGFKEAQRYHGAFVSEDEVLRVVKFLKQQATPDYQLKVVQEVNANSNNADSGAHRDNEYMAAHEIVISEQKASASYLQRRLKIGYNKAARIMEHLEQDGVVSKPDTSGNRRILINS